MKFKGSVFLAAVAAFAFTASAASAADMPLKAPIYKAPPIFRWEGPYAGASIGVGTLDPRNRVACGDAASCLSQSLGNIPTDLNERTAGIIVGPRLGYNKMYGPMLLGIVTDIAYTDLSSHAQVTQGFANATTTFDKRIDYIGTLRGRIGYAFDRTLFFATGGLAYGNVKESATIIPGPGIVGQANAGSQSDLRAGWTVGAGIEYAIDRNWSIDAEYLYYDLGSSRLTTTTFNGIAPSETVYFDSKTDGHIIRAGFNYHF